MSTPFRPMVRALQDPDDGSMAVHVFNLLASDPGYLVTVNAVFRQVGAGGKLELLSDAVPPNSTFIDYAAPTAGPVTYIVLAVNGSASPATYAYSAPTNASLKPERCDEYVWLSGGPGFSTVGKFRGSPTVSTTHNKGRVLREALSEVDPVQYSGKTIDHSVSFTGIIEESNPLSTEGRFTQIHDWEGLVLYRDAWGRRVFGSMDSVKFDQMAHGLQTFSGKVTQTYVNGLSEFTWNTDIPLPPPLTSVQIIILLNNYPNSGVWDDPWDVIWNLPEFDPNTSDYLVDYGYPNTWAMDNGTVIWKDPTTGLWLDDGTTISFDVNLGTFTLNMGPDFAVAFAGIGGGGAIVLDPSMVESYGTASAPCSPGLYMNPGDKYLMPSPAFYPGEFSTDRWGSSVRSGGVWGSADLSKLGDGSTSILSTGDEIISMGYSKWWYDFTPRPATVTKGMWYVRLKGTGSFRIRCGVEQTWNWLWTGTGNLSEVTEFTAWKTFNVASTGWAERSIPLPAGMLTTQRMEDNITYVGQIEILSGTLEFDTVDWWVAGDCGFHRIIGDVPSQTFPKADAIVGQGIKKTTIVARSFIEPAGTTHYVGGLQLPPTTDIRAAVSPMVSAVRRAGIPATTAVPSTPIPADAASYAIWAGINTDTNASVSYHKSPWEFLRASYTADNNARYTWGWGGNEPGPNVTFNATYLEFDGSTFPKPANTPTIASLFQGKIGGLHYSTYAVYDNMDTAFLGWVKVGNGWTWSTQNYDGYDTGIGINASIPRDFQSYGQLNGVLEINTTWRPGNPTPPAGSGTKVADIIAPPVEGNPAQTMFDVVLADVPMPTVTSFALFLYFISDGLPVNVSAALSMNIHVEYPPYHYMIPQLQYYGG